MIAEANVWLTKNREWEVINCETVLLFFKRNDNGAYAQAVFQVALIDWDNIVRQETINHNSIYPFVNTIFSLRLSIALGAGRHM